MSLIHVAQDKVQWQAVLKRVIKPWAL